MTPKDFNKVYVVTRDEAMLYSQTIYTKPDAESVQAVAIDCGYTQAEIITLKQAFERSIKID